FQVFCTISSSYAQQQGVELMSDGDAIEAGRTAHAKHFTRIWATQGFGSPFIFIAEPSLSRDEGEGAPGTLMDGVLVLQAVAPPQQQLLRQAKVVPVSSEKAASAREREWLVWPEGPLW